MGACCSNSSLEHLSGSPLNHVLGPSQLEQLSAVFRMRTFEAGIQIYAADTVQSTVLMIVAGEVEVLSGFSVLCVKRTQNFLGLTGVIKGRHTFSCRATKDRNVLVVEAPIAEFERVAQTFDPAVREAVSTLCGDSVLVNPLLRRLDFLEEMDDFDLRLVSAVLTPLFFNPGQVVFAEGSDGKDLYVVQSGTVQAIHVRDEKEFILTEFKAGDIFGELALFLDIPRSAMVRSNRPTLLLQLRKDDFVQFTLMLGSDRLNFKKMVQQRIAEQFRKYKLPFFESIPADKYDVLAQMAQVRTIEPNTTLFKQGDTGDAFWIIAFGEMSVRIAKADNKVEEVARMGPGKYFGEIALVRDAPRTATVVSSKRSVLLMISKENFVRFFARAPEAIADFEVKLARTDCHLKSVLYHPIGLKYFEKHLSTEFSVENVTFWKACRDYRHLASRLIDKKAADTHLQLQLKANDILSQYITEESATQVNIPAPTRKTVIANVRAGKVDADTFHAAEMEIINLMNTDSFSRYRHTQLFQDFLEAVESYRLDWDLDHNIDTHVKAKIRSASNAVVDAEPGSQLLSSDYAMRVSKSTEHRAAAAAAAAAASGTNGPSQGRLLLHPSSATAASGTGGAAGLSAAGAGAPGSAYDTKLPLNAPILEPLTAGAFADRAQLAILGSSLDYALLPAPVRRQRLSQVSGPDTDEFGQPRLPTVAESPASTRPSTPATAPTATTTAATATATATTTATAAAAAAPHATVTVDVTRTSTPVVAVPTELPPGWTAHSAPNGAPYYYNTATRVSTYVLPPAVVAAAAATMDAATAATPASADTAPATASMNGTSSQHTSPHTPTRVVPLLPGTTDNSGKSSPAAAAPPSGGGGESFAGVLPSA